MSGDGPVAVRFGCGRADREGIPGRRHRGVNWGDEQRRRVGRIGGDPAIQRVRLRRTGFCGVWSSRPSSRGRSSSWTTGPQTGRRSWWRLSTLAPDQSGVPGQPGSVGGAQRRRRVGEWRADCLAQRRRPVAAEPPRSPGPAILKKPEIAWAYNDFARWTPRGGRSCAVSSEHPPRPSEDIAGGIFASDLMVLPSASLLEGLRSTTSAALTSASGVRGRRPVRPDVPSGLEARLRARAAHPLRMHANGTNSS